MVEIYLEAPGIEHRLTAALRRCPDHQISRDWSRFARNALRADIAVVVADRISCDGLITRLAELRERIRPTPLVVAVRRDADEARALAAIAPSRILWLDELEAQLYIAIDGFRSEGLLERIATECARRRDLSPIVRSAVVAACRANPPILTVTRLAKSVRWSCLTTYPPHRLVRDRLLDTGIVCCSN